MCRLFSFSLRSSVLVFNTATFSTSLFLSLSLSLSFFVSFTFNELRTRCCFGASHFFYCVYTHQLLHRSLGSRMATAVTVTAAASNCSRCALRKPTYTSLANSRQTPCLSTETAPHLVALIVVKLGHESTPETRERNPTDIADTALRCHVPRSEPHMAIFATS